MAESRYAYTAYIRATAPAVWDALLSAEAMKAYFFALPFEADPKTGGSWRRSFPTAA